jgi:hypothetical protein
MPFYILASNPQIIRGDMKNWKIHVTDTLAEAEETQE